MTADETAFIPKSAATYAELGEVHSVECAKSFEEVEQDKFRREDIKYRSEDYKVFPDAYVPALTSSSSQAE